MIFLMTGASSKIGLQLLEKLIARPETEQVYALTRSASRLSEAQKKYPDKLKIIEGDLAELSWLQSVPRVDLCFHLAALTHSKNENEYFKTNQVATRDLAKALQNKGCQKICFISSETAGENAGAYALSKFLAEKSLLEMNWQQLIIIRPTEIVGAGSNEGLDKFFKLAHKLKIYPWLIASFSDLHRIAFHPLSANALNTAILETVFENKQSPLIQTICGPKLSSTDLVFQLFKKEKALPIPVYIPLLKLLVGVFNLLGLKPIPPDQIPRLLGLRKQSPVAGLTVSEKVVEPGI